MDRLSTRQRLVTLLISSAVALTACGGPPSTEARARSDARAAERLAEHRRDWIDLVDATTYVFSPREGIECVTIAYQEALDCDWHDRESNPQ